MAMDTYVVYLGVYGSREDAEADYEAIKELHVEEGVMDAYDAAVIARDDKGKVKITKKHETPTRVGGVLGGGIGLATGLVVALFPFAAIGGGLIALTTAGGAALGAVAGVDGSELRAQVARLAANEAQHLSAFRARNGAGAFSPAFPPSLSIEQSSAVLDNFTS